MPALPVEGLLGAGLLVELPEPELPEPELPEPELPEPEPLAAELGGAGGAGAGRAAAPVTGREFLPLAFAAARGLAVLAPPDGPRSRTSAASASAALS